jgi:hypothetical protein
MANTTTADATCTSGAIQIAADYANNGKSDWHLPSKEELLQLYEQRRVVGIPSTGIYSSSSEGSSYSVWHHLFYFGYRTNYLKGEESLFRVVRAF